MLIFTQEQIDEIVKLPDKQLTNEFIYIVCIDPSKPEKVDRVGKVSIAGLFPSLTIPNAIKLNERLNGVVDGVNTTFTTDMEYVIGTIMVIQNGLFTFDFVEIDNTTIQFNIAPLIGDVIRCIYEKA